MVGWPIATPTLRQATPSRPRALVAFDLDGTLLRGPTVCELLAGPLGRLPDMKRFEALTTEADIAASRVEMAGWYRGVPLPELCAPLGSATWAPGAQEGVRLLRTNGVEVVIASITWRFGAEWYAKQLGVNRVLATGLGPDGEVQHVWPREKRAWLRSLASELAVPHERIAAVGDSPSDHDLLSEAALRFFVGSGNPPPLPNLRHRPTGDIHAIASEILDSWNSLASA